MAAVKRLNTTYTLDTTDVYVTGNLHVAGVYDTTTVNNINVEDKDIALNVGETGAGVGGGSGTSGIIVDRGSLADVALRWNDTTDVWQLTTDGSTFNTILTAGGGGGLTAVVDDTSPQLGGNLETNGFHIQFDNTLITPSAVPNAVLIGAAAPGSAGSGLFVVNSSTALDELVTKSKAIVFSIIL
jgi:hypothetical protein